MTHSLHRQGSIEDLKKDYVMLAQLARGINDKIPSVREKMFRIGEIFNRHNPTSIMNEAGWRVSSTITASFDNIENVKQALTELKNEDLGISIVVSGLIDDIKEVTGELGLKPHTAHLSLGVFGKKDLLPSKKIMELTTMCGHHCVSPQSIEFYVDLIKNGKINIEKAAQILANPCVCGIVNPVRVKSILNKMIM